MYIVMGISFFTREQALTELVARYVSSGFTEDFSEIVKELNDRETPSMLIEAVGGSLGPFVEETNGQEIENHIKTHSADILGEVH